MRVGFGEDLHRMIPGRPLILGGVNIPHDRGFLGHSDADALVHAIIDSLLGAAALGDIGQIFPDTDEKFRGANSLALLKQTANLLAENCFKIINIDSTIVIEAPKLAPFIVKMRENIAFAAGINASYVSVKVKTAEKTGDIGHGLAAEAFAVCLVEARFI
jgi:2-C-methyl-D-erythritol 2,4-cyclodiphosphate synthase